MGIYSYLCIITYCFWTSRFFPKKNTFAKVFPFAISIAISLSMSKKQELCGIENTAYGMGLRTQRDEREGG